METRQEVLRNLRFPLIMSVLMYVAAAGHPIEFVKWVGIGLSGALLGTTILYAVSGLLVAPMFHRYLDPLGRNAKVPIGITLLVASIGLFIVGVQTLPVPNFFHGVYVGLTLWSGIHCLDFGFTYARGGSIHKSESSEGNMTRKKEEIYE